MTLRKPTFLKVAPIRAAFATMVTVACLAMLGCSNRPSAIRPPDIDPQKVAAGAMKIYDANADGKIDRKELESAPSLRFSVGRIDSNYDSKLTSDEIADFAQKQWVERASGILRVRCEVASKGRPIDGATVIFEPEVFMDDAVKPASGVTRGGKTYLDVSNEDRPSPTAHGVQNGLYLVRISKVVNGKEQIPTKYNEHTILGCEVADHASYMPGPVVFDIFTN